MPEKKLTVAEKKRLDMLDRKIERVVKKISTNRDEHEILIEELKKLQEERYPERETENVKEVLYKAYNKSDRSMEEILAFLEGRDDDIMW